jgi:hypothetical protein
MGPRPPTANMSEFPNTAWVRLHLRRSTRVNRPLGNRPRVRPAFPATPIHPATTRFSTSRQPEISFPIPWIGLWVCRQIYSTASLTTWTALSFRRCRQHRGEGPCNPKQRALASGNRLWRGRLFPLLPRTNERRGDGRYHSRFAGTTSVYFTLAVAEKPTLITVNRR